jgi:hypothetical protein
LDGIIEFLTWAGIVVVIIAAIGFTFGRLYHRAERDEAFVRTGVGGRRVVKDGGAIILPIVHALARVKLNTVKLVVDRRREDAFITADRMRVDIRAEFYVRVDITDDGIGLAAQTLGDRVNDPKAIQDLSRPSWSTRCARSQPATRSINCTKAAPTSSRRCRRRSRPTCAPTAWSWNRSALPASTRRRRSFSTRPTPSTRSAWPS